LSQIVGKETKPIESAKAVAVPVAVVAPVVEKEREEIPEPETEVALAEADVAAPAPLEEAEPVTDVEAIVAAPPTPVEETKPVDIEGVRAEVEHLLAGESYNERVVGAASRETRQLVATELLSAIAGRNLERRERAREAYIKHAYLDEATYDLRTADAPAERAYAARALGSVRDRAATPHLVAALEDSAPEVRRAVVDALRDMRDPAAIIPLNE